MKKIRLDELRNKRNVLAKLQVEMQLLWNDAEGGDAAAWEQFLEAEEKEAILLEQIRDIRRRFPAYAA